VTTTVAALADRVLGRLDIVIVPVSERPANTATVPVASIAASALQRLGVIIPASGRTPVTAITPLADLGSRALEMLGVFDPGEAPSAADLATATTAIQALNDSMLARGMVAWQADAIPEAASEEYTQLGAIYLAPGFGKAADVAQRPIIEARIGRIALVMNAQPMAEAKVAELNASMIARGNVSWTDIPASAAEQYIQITALALAPLFGQEADVKLFAMLEDRIRQISVIARAPDDAKDAVMAVHTELASSDKVRWSVFDIPPSAEMPYIIKAANRIAMNFGKDVDARAEAQADVLLARIIALPTSGEVTRAEYF
jgi:hypothetical protein